MRVTPAHAGRLPPDRRLRHCSPTATRRRWSSTQGSIDWLCLPRFDSPALFARILDPEAGHWSICPVESFTSKRRYLPGTLVVETTFTTDSGVVRLTDALAFADGQRGHDLGTDAPHELVRTVECVSGDAWSCRWSWPRGPSTDWSARSSGVPTRVAARSVGPARSP